MAILTERVFPFLLQPNICTTKDVPESLLINRLCVEEVHDADSGLRPFAVLSYLEMFPHETVATPCAISSQRLLHGTTAWLPGSQISPNTRLLKRTINSMFSREVIPNGRIIPTVPFAPTSPSNITQAVPLLFLVLTSLFPPSL